MWADMTKQDLELSIFGTTKLKSLIETLERAPQDADIEFDFCNLVPTSVASYRGYYDHLAIGWTGEHERPKASMILATLKDANGKTFEGYKGGSYRMGPNTPVWVCNYGHTSGTGIISIEYTDSLVVMNTARVD
jgi:hypothetical protein